MVTIPRLAQKEGNAEVAMENIEQYCIVFNYRKIAKANQKKKSGRKKQIKPIVPD